MTRGPLLRPLVHAGMLGFAFLGPVLGRWGMAEVAFAAFLANLLLLPRTSFGRALRREGEPRWNGLVAYPLAVALAYAIFQPEVAATAWAVMAVGDPAATLVGTARPWKVRLFHNRRKSAAGSLAFLLAAWAGAFGVLAVCERGDPVPLVLVGAVAALAGAVVESLPIPGDDNLPVVLAAGGALTWLFSGLSFP